jgi:glyoxylase-like metal-dependent hydrolase (beta-lactamase superfamily II)
MAIPLEDSFSDIVGKAMRGLKLTDAHAAESAGVTPAAINQLRDGQWDEAVARKVAPVLGLKADALADLGNKAWTPSPISMDGLAQFNTIYEDMTVNSYLVWDPASKQAVAFDTGSDASGMLALVTEKGLRISLILLTHTHGDHIFDLDRLTEKTGAPAFVSLHEPLEGVESFDAGREFSAGGLKIESRLTWGHSKGGITYVVSGLSRPVAIVGDAIFAGSMGGGGVSYSDALHTNRAEILSLPDETILCPGHGPLTTVGEQKVHNPFFP